VGFKKSDGKVFLQNILNYGDKFLFYDGHPGYDYPYPANTDILAPATGTLCVAHNKTTGPTTGDQVWRNTGMCPFKNIPGQPTTNWTNYHAFYILHGILNLDGMREEYMSVFLHSKNLSPEVMTAVQAQGYATVARSQFIADIGKVGTGGNHMHFEMYKMVGDTWTLIDPYGDGIGHILWAPLP
jgi:murein DD-endopeptidase MepM/ murein hydrolase activator NlpD